MKKHFLSQLFTCASVLALSQVYLHAAGIVSEGILGNSGEAGPTLVRFGGRFWDYRAFSQGQGAASEAGLGAAADRYGFIWDRAGSGVLNRYAVDGRLIGQYKIATGAQLNDQMTIVGDVLLLQIKSKLYTLSVNAAAGSEAKPLNMDSQAISFGSYEGTVASIQGAKIVRLDPATGAVTDWMETPQGRINSIELTPDGTLAIAVDRNMLLYTKNGMETGKTIPGDAMQFIHGYWYGHQWHGTIKRFDANLEASPGVVLGGGSGSFIGKLDGNYEISSGRGMAKIGPDLFDISGASGIHHLLQWDEANNRFEIIRRIGSVAGCRGLALDDKGMIRYNTGAWKWSDGPAAPQILGSPISLCGPVAWLSSGIQLGPAVQYGNSPRFLMLRSGDVFNPSMLPDETKFFAKGIIGSAAYRINNQLWLLLQNPNGAARRYRVSGNGDYAKEAADVVITPATPVKEWTGLAGAGENMLIGCGDGYVIEFAREGENWKETRRWNSWEGDKFGDRIEISVDGGRLWVTDTSRHRVLCFTQNGDKVLGIYGATDKAGDDLASLSAPMDIAARGSRAVVYDSGNQRLVKLVLQ